MYGDRIFSLMAEQLLLIGQGHYTDLGNRFRQGGSSFQAGNSLLLLGVLAALVAIVWLVSRYISIYESGGCYSPRRLFRELCRGHRLGWTDRQLLRQLARWHRLPNAAQLFVEPHRFDLEKLKPVFAEHTAQLATLRDRLFTCPAVPDVQSEERRVKS
jgi:hypothetical protein